MTTPLYLDNTALSALHKCPRSFYWRHVRHLVPARDTSSPLAFGVALHRGLEEYYLGRPIEDCIAAFIASWKEQGSPDDDKRNVMTGTRILLDYHAKYNRDPLWRVEQVESRIVVEIASDLIFCGRVDLIIELMGQYYIVDHKSTGNMSSFIAKPNHQMSGYIFAARSLGIPASGAIYNMLAVLKTKSDFARPMTTRSEADLDRWRITVLEAKARIDAYSEGGVWPMYTTGCFMCSYKDLCNAETQPVLDHTIHSLYREEEWKPWEQEG